MIDSHIHLLPGIDDGAADFDIALKMAQVADNDGIQKIICTPHDLNSVYQNSKTKVIDTTKLLQDKISETGLGIIIYPGAELHIDLDLVSKVLNGDVLTLANQNKHVLIEFPKHSIPHGSENILENLLFNKYTPIIAHPERNPTLSKSPELLREWVSWGCKAQLTAMSVTGEFSTGIQSTCRQWCHQGLIHLVASDAHRPTGRAPILSKARSTLTEWLGESSADILVNTNPQNIIDGSELENIPVSKAPRPKKDRKPLFSFLKRKKSSRKSARF